MKMLVNTARIAMGVIFVVMGINGFIQFMPMPDKGPEAMAFFEALERTTYFWPFEKICEILFGILLLINRWTVLAIEGLAPIIANIILFHLFLDMPGMPLALVVLACEMVLIIAYWRSHISGHFRTTKVTG